MGSLYSDCVAISCCRGLVSSVCISARVLLPWGRVLAAASCRHCADGYLRAAGLFARGACGRDHCWRSEDPIARNTARSPYQRQLKYRRLRLHTSPTRWCRCKRENTAMPAPRVSRCACACSPCASTGVRPRISKNYVHETSSGLKILHLILNKYASNF